MLRYTKPAMFILIALLTISFNSIYAISNLPGDDDYAAFAEEMPSPIGGMAAIQKNVTYPSMAKQARVEGKVFLLAYIDENGGVDNVKVIKGIGAGCDEAAASAIKKVKFNPGKAKGQPIKVKLSLTLTFKL